MMNENVKFLFGMIASVLDATAEKPTVPENADWEYILKLSVQHSVAGLVAYAVKQNDYQVPEEVASAFFSLLYQNVLVSENQLNDVKQIFASFEEKKISYMPLKGVELKYMYPSCELRTMGDADILIRLEDYAKIKKVMAELGYEFQTESNHEFIYTKKPFTRIELHKCMIPSYNEDLYEYYGDGWKLAVPMADHVSRYRLSDENMYIYLFSHFAKHYRDAGAGIKYVIDLWLYCMKHPELDTAYIEKQLEKLGLLAFYSNVMRLICCWFSDGEPDAVTEQMTEFILESGTHGSLRHKASAQAIRDYMDKDVEKAGKYRYLRMLFPNLRTMKIAFPILEKAPFLLPLCWVLRLVKGVIFKRKNISYHVEKANHIDSVSVSVYNIHMKKVGLDIYNGRKKL